MTEFIRNAWYAVCWSDELGVTPHPDKFWERILRSIELQMVSRLQSRIVARIGSRRCHWVS